MRPDAVLTPQFDLPKSSIDQRQVEGLSHLATELNDEVVGLRRELEASKREIEVLRHQIQRQAKL